MNSHRGFPTMIPHAPMPVTLPILLIEGEKTDGSRYESWAVTLG